jgi:hypothetical protein
MPKRITTNLNIQRISTGMYYLLLIILELKSIADFGYFTK